MRIISIRDNENSISKRNAKKQKTKKQTDRKEQQGREAMVKGWELKDFLVHLS